MLARAGLLGADISTATPLMEAGLDSIGAVEMRNEVNRKYGIELPATVMYDYPTIGDLCHSHGAAVTLPGLQALQSMVSGLLGQDIGTDVPLMEAGLDSIGAVELRNSVASQYGIDLPPTVTFDQPTVRALADYLAAVLAPQRRTALATDVGSFELVSLLPSPKLLQSWPAVM